MEVNKKRIDIDPGETSEWMESLESVFKTSGPDRAVFLLRKMRELLQASGAQSRELERINTSYINTITKENEPVYPGDIELERKISRIIRWNAAAMVVAANKTTNVGGHISSYQSAAWLYDVGFNHFFQGPKDDFPGDFIFFQGHISPGIYARSFLEGRIDENLLKNFRQELKEGGGLSSYPHPRLMSEYWQFPTVSMGLAPMLSIYHARFAKYLQNRKLQTTSQQKIWAFLGDGEMDEPESLGALTVATRENLDNLIFVVNCNLQRLDGPVRGNGKIIQELEGVYRGAGWNVLKVIWGSPWDELFLNDHTGNLIKLMNETVDGEYQKYVVSTGDYIRKNYFGRYPELLKLVEHLSDRDIEWLSRGGHDPRKIYAAYKWATENKNGRPTVILAHTIKGYGLSEGQGRNSTHQKKKLSDKELIDLKNRLEIPITDQAAIDCQLYHPGNSSKEVKYLLEKRAAHNGFLPRRKQSIISLALPTDSIYEDFKNGSGDREVSTTIGYVSLLVKLLKDENIGKLIVPIIPDEARTFGMEALFKQFGIYSNKGQLYEPVDKNALLYYHEATDGQLLQEGINEGGAMASFIAAGSSYANFNLSMIPFYTYYAMFGFQRIGDLAWAAYDMKAKGFMIGATAGRTTLNGEGLQHQDGQSHIYAATIPNLKTYDPAYMFEVAVIIKHGLKRMYEKNLDEFYYLTVYNENYKQAKMPEWVEEEDIVKGLYLFEKPTIKNSQKINILSSGPMLNEALKAKKILEEQHQIQVTLFSAPSFKNLRDEALEIEKHNIDNPADKKRTQIDKILGETQGHFVAVTDYMSLYPDMISRFLPNRMITLGTDGGGMSDTRERLRSYFGIDAKAIVKAALVSF